MIKGIHHAGLSVSDLDAAIAFYATAHAFHEVHRFSVLNTPQSRALLQVDDPSADVALLAGTNGFLEIFAFKNRPMDQAPQQPAIHHAGIRHMCLQAVACDPLYDQFVAAGATTHARPSGLGTGHLYCYIRDPEANILELEGVPHATALQSDPWLAHIAIVTPDIVRLAAFYTVLTGNAPHNTGSFGPGRRFDTVAGLEGVEFDGAWIKAGDTQIELWHYRHPVTEAAKPANAARLGWNHVAFEVEDVEADYARLMAAGIVFHGPPASRGHAKLVFGRDPDGNIFELLELLPNHLNLSLDALPGRHILANLSARADQTHVTP